jgi:hypothetical protein
MAFESEADETVDIRLISLTGQVIRTKSWKTAEIITRADVKTLPMAFIF